MYKLYQTDSPGIGTKAGWEVLLLVWKPKKVIVIDITQCVYVCVSHKLHLRRQRVIKTHESPLQCRGKGKQRTPSGLLCILLDLLPVRIWRKRQEGSSFSACSVESQANHVGGYLNMICQCHISAPPHPRSMCTLASGGVCILLMRFCHKDLKKSLDDWEHIPVDS